MDIQLTADRIYLAGGYTDITFEILFIAYGIEQSFYNAGL